MTKRETETVKTLAYFDLFDYPLTQKELEFWAGSSEIPKRFVAQEDGYYFLNGRRKIIDTRKERKRISENKLEIITSINRLIKIIPFVQAVFSTGSLAMDNTEDGGDIDLLIVTSANSLWLTRILVVGILLMRGRYRRVGRVKDMICPNIFLDENFLDLSTQKSLFAAHEILQAKPIFDRGGYYKRFIKVNSWVKEYLPEAYKNTVIKSKITRRIGGQRPQTQIKNQRFSNFILNFAPCALYFAFTRLNKLAFGLQKKFMLKKMTNEYISLHRAFFHPRPLANSIEADYQKKLEKLGINF